MDLSKSLIKTCMVLLLAITANSSIAATGKPNILLIMSDDVGITNISAYSMRACGLPDAQY